MGQLVIVTTRDLAPGFALAGVRTLVAETAEDARRTVTDVLAEPTTAVVGVHEPFLAAFPPGERRRLEESLSPLVIALPTGARTGGRGEHRARLSELLRRAIGYHVTFRPKGP